MPCPVGGTGGGGVLLEGTGLLRGWPHSRLLRHRRLLSGDDLTPGKLKLSSDPLSRSYLIQSVNLLLDMAREKCGGISDAELARRIHVTPQTLNQWRKHTSPIPDSRIAQVAHIARSPAEYWLVLLQAEKAKTPKIREHWMRVFRVLESAAAVLLLVAMPHAGSSTVLPATLVRVDLAIPEQAADLCIMRSVMRCITRFARKCAAALRGAGHVRPSALLA